MAVVKNQNHSFAQNYKEITQNLQKMQKPQHLFLKRYNCRERSFLAIMALAQFIFTCGQAKNSPKWQKRWRAVRHGI